MLLYRDNLSDSLMTLSFVTYYGRTLYIVDYDSETHIMEFTPRYLEHEIRFFSSQIISYEPMELQLTPYQIQLIEDSNVNLIHLILNDLGINKDIYIVKYLSYPRTSGDIYFNCLLGGPQYIIYYYNKSNGHFSVDDQGYFQLKLTAGSGITIDENNVISSTGGGNGIYNIVFTMDDNEVITCDKTFDEVLAAKQSGMVVVGKMNIPNMWSSEYSVDGHLPLTAYVEDTNHNKWLEFSGASSNSIYDANTITSTAIRWYQSSSRSSEHIYFNVAYADREILGTVDSFVDLRYETTSTDDDASDDGELLTQAIYGKQVLVYFANDWFTVKVPLTFTNVTTLSDAYNTKIYSGESLYRVPYPNGEWTKYKSMRLTLTLTTTQYGGGQINYALTTKTEEVKSTNFYTVQVPNTGWTQDTTAGWYTKSVTVNGILSTDNPIVDIDLSSAATASAITSLLTDWAKILRISTSANTITLYASSAISQAISLKLQVTR